MSKPREEDDGGREPSYWLARHKVYLAPEGTLSNSYASQRIRLKQGGLLGIKTHFQGGDFCEAELMKVLKPKGGVESAVDVAEHHWSEMKAELEQLRDEVGLYARLKTRGRLYDEVANDLMIWSIGNYAGQWETSRGDRRREVDSGLESSACAPHTSAGERLAWFRGTLNESPERYMRALKLDQVERGLMRIARLFQETAMHYSEFASDTPQQSEGGLLMRDGKRRPPMSPMQQHASAFFRGTEEVLEAASAAWWSAAAKMARDEKPDEAEVRKNAEILGEKIGAVKKAFQQLEQDAADTHMAYEFAPLKELVTGHDERQQKGLIPMMDKVYGVVSRENLLQSAIEAGRAQPKGRK